MNQSQFSLAVFRKLCKKLRSNFRHSQMWFSSIYLYPEQPYQVKEYGVTEVTLFPVGTKYFSSKPRNVSFSQRKSFEIMNS